jgi:hypothetical protein
MTTIQIQSQVSLDELLTGVEQLSTPDLERFADQVLAVRARRRAPSLPQREAELLQKINQGLPATIQQRFDELTARRQAETLTNEEHRELLQIVEQIEQRDAQRITHLAELAQLRHVHIRTLMNQLGIQPPAYV